MGQRPTDGGSLRRQWLDSALRNKFVQDSVCSFPYLPNRKLGTRWTRAFWIFAFSCSTARGRNGQHETSLLWQNPSQLLYMWWGNVMLYFLKPFRKNMQESPGSCSFTKDTIRADRTYVYLLYLWRPWMRPMWGAKGMGETPCLFKRHTWTDL